MNRKFALVLAAVAALGAVSLNATTASAWHGKKHHHKHWKNWKSFHYGQYYGPGYFYGPDCYVVRRAVWTKYGKRIRRQLVCY